MKGRSLIVPALAGALLLAAASVDHFFRDEFYYLACTHRMAWGYVDQPPLSVAVLWLVRHVAGDSLMALRAAAALAFSATVWTTGGIARRLGARTFGELFAMVTVALMPMFLGIGSFYSMNVLDVLLWTISLRVLIDALDRPSGLRWLALGVVLGLGLLNKISVLWLGAGIGAALMLTPARAQLRTRGPYLAAFAAAALFLPHVLWQAAHGWPTLEFIRNASRDKMQATPPLAFMLDQILNLGPPTLLVWGAGLIALLAHPRLRRWRALGIVYLAAAAIVMANRTSRSEYLLPAYPTLAAAGAVWWEAAVRARAARVALTALIVVPGLAAVPLAVAILPVESYVRYARALGMAPSTDEKKELGRLPQFLADRQGWDAFVDQMAAAWDRLAPDERARAAVFAGNYGEAGAIERLGRDRGLAAISGHNNYWLWGPAGRTGEVLVVLARDDVSLRARFDSVERAGQTDCGDCMPYENHLGIYICRRMRMPLPQLWPMLKHFD